MQVGALMETAAEGATEESEGAGEDLCLEVEGCDLGVCDVGFFAPRRGPPPVPRLRPRVAVEAGAMCSTGGARDRR